MLKEIFYWTGMIILLVIMCLCAMFVGLFAVCWFAAEELDRRYNETNEQYSKVYGSRGND